MKSTFYGHFVAGEDQKGIRSNVENMMKYGVKSILDYSAEEDLSSESSVKNSFQNESSKIMSNRKIVDPSEYQSEKNTKIFLDCIDAVSDVTAATGIGAVKLTSLVRPQLLLKFSSLFSELKKIDDQKNLITWKQLVSKTPKELSEYFNNMPALKVK
jgi:proline dehydrogenase